MVDARFKELHPHALTLEEVVFRVLIWGSSSVILLRPKMGVEPLTHDT